MKQNGGVRHTDQRDMHRRVCLGKEQQTWAGAGPYRECLRCADRRAAFTTVQSLMKERAPVHQHPKRVASPVLFRGLAKCGYCGKALAGRYAKSGKFAYYACGTLDKKGAGSCPAHYVNANQFEALVIDRIKNRILTRENLEELARLVNEETDLQMKSLRDELDLISGASTDADHRLERLYDAIESGKVTVDDLVIRIRELRSRQEQLQARRITIENQMSDRKVDLADLKSISGSLNDLYVLLSEGTLAERRTFIRSLVKEVQVMGNNAVMNYTMPILPENLIIQKEGVLPTVQYSGRYRT